MPTEINLAPSQVRFGVGYASNYRPTPKMATEKK